MHFKNDVVSAGGVRKGQIAFIDGGYHRVAGVMRPQGKSQSGFVHVTYLRNGPHIVTLPIGKYVGIKRKPRKIYV